MQEIDWLDEPSRATKRILFARHGEYEGNVRNVCNCDPRIPFVLTPHGAQQARALGERLSDQGIELIVSSEFLRARQTAWLANQALDVPIVVNRLANENRVGTAFEGQAPEVFLQSIRADPANLANPGGESFVDMKARLRSLIDQILLGSSRTVLVLTHGWPMQSVRVLQGVLPDAQAALCDGMPGNCEIVDGCFSMAGGPALQAETARIGSGRRTMRVG